MSVYAVVNQLEYRGSKVPVIKPDNVSLGKCVTCHSFVRKYASINDIETINMLRDGCNFKGFKKIKVDSPEEEGFANMHFILLLYTDITTRAVCARRKRKLTLKINSLEKSCEAITDSASCVIIIVDKRNTRMELYHFSRSVMKKFVLDYQCSEIKFFLMSDILYIEDKSSLCFVNFSTKEPFRRTMELKDNQEVFECSRDMIVLLEKPLGNEKQFLVCDALLKTPVQTLLTLSDDIVKEFVESKVTVIRSRKGLVWLVCGKSKLSLFSSSPSLQELSLCTSFNLEELFPESTDFVFSTACNCVSTNQAFLMYSKNVNMNSNSFILVIDMEEPSVSSVLELQWTVNRKPQVVMHASRSGHKLFVQETFENKMIFYQVFTLLPNQLSLHNITKRFIWETMSEDVVKNIRIPNHLKEELKDGF